MSQVLSFLRAIAREPDDDAARLVFADWLEERGDRRAEYLRLDSRLQRLAEAEPGYADLKSRWQELRSRLSPSWLTVLGRSEIENCEDLFKFRCPQRWEKLRATEVAAVRFCDTCRKSVYYCSSLEEAREHARAGHCVAVDAGVAREPGDLWGDEGSLVGLLVD
jgi:uncharacterized protein (TIGR02996 family)